jgi:hypothetical protein
VSRLHGSAASAIALTILVLMGQYGCGAETERPPASADEEPALAPVAVNDDMKLRTGPCEIEGETIACKVKTGQAGKIVNCFEGVQTCSGGTWSACGEGVDTGSQ